MSIFLDSSLLSLCFSSYLAMSTCKDSAQPKQWVDLMFPGLSHQNLLWNTTTLLALLFLHENHKHLSMLCCAMNGINALRKKVVQLHRFQLNCNTIKYFTINYVVKLKLEWKNKLFHLNIFLIILYNKFNVYIMHALVSTNMCMTTHLLGIKSSKSSIHTHKYFVMRI